MNLQTFSDQQVKTVRARAAKLRLYRSLIGASALKMEELAKRELALVTDLKGVSMDELLNEVDFPGTFSNT